MLASGLERPVLVGMDVDFAEGGFEGNEEFDYWDVAVLACCLERLSVVGMDIDFAMGGFESEEAVDGV